MVKKMRKFKSNIIHALQSEHLSINKLVEISDICDVIQKEVDCLYDNFKAILLAVTAHCIDSKLSDSDKLHRIETCVHNRLERTKFHLEDEDDSIAKKNESENEKYCSHTLYCHDCNDWVIRGKLKTTLKVKVKDDNN